MPRVFHHLSAGCQSDLASQPSPLSMWHCSHCTFSSLNHHTCKDSPTPGLFCRPPLVISLAVHGLQCARVAPCTTCGSGVMNESVPDVILQLVFPGCFWLHLRYFRFSKRQVPRLDLLRETGREPEETGTAVRLGCGSNCHGGEGWKEAWIAKVLD